MNKNLEEISDGKIYRLHDMVRAACNDCEGCHSCCEDMGDSIILDPLDVYLLQKNLGTSVESMIEKKIELRMVDGLILPNMMMSETTNCCVFLIMSAKYALIDLNPEISGRLVPPMRFPPPRSTKT